VPTLDSVLRPSREAMTPSGRGILPVGKGAGRGAEDHGVRAQMSQAR